MKKCHDRYLTSDLKQRDVDMKWATVYLVLKMNSHEVVMAGLGKLVRRRKVRPNCKLGKIPTVLTMSTDEKDDEKRWT